MSVRNSPEKEVDSAVTPPPVASLGKDKEAQEAVVNPREAAPEPPQFTGEDKPAVAQDDHDQDDVSVRGAWVQGVLEACGPLGTGPGDSLTTADSGQNLMTPGTTMSMSRTSLSTPTVTGGGCPSDEPSEPQPDEVNEDHVSTETIVSCSDGDLLLHIRYQPDNGQGATPEESAQILSLKVSSTVLRIASAPLRNLLDAPPASRSRAQTGLHHLIAIHEPRVWGCRERKGTVALILRAPNPEQLRQAALIVFNILHLNKNYLPAETPSMLQIAWVAEFAWVLGCLSPIVPWIRSWIAGSPAVRADTRLVSALFLGFVLGDSETFEQASLHWVLRGKKSDFDRFNDSSLGVMIVIHEALQRKRQEVARGLIVILDESLRGYCDRSKKQGSDFDQTFILGSFFNAVCDSSTGVSIMPYYHTPVPNPPFQFLWQPQINDQSVNFRLGKLLAITEKFNNQLQLHPRDIFSQWKNPVPLLAANVVALREKLRGLRLQDYRPGVVKLMCVKSCLGNLAEETELELLQLKEYSRRPVEDNFQCTWRTVVVFFSALFVTIMTIGICTDKTTRHSPTS